MAYKTRCGPRGRFKSGPRKGHCKPKTGRAATKRRTVRKTKRRTVRKTARRAVRRTKRRCAEWAPYFINGKSQKRCARYVGSKSRQPKPSNRMHGPTQSRWTP